MFMCEKLEGFACLIMQFLTFLSVCFNCIFIVTVLNIDFFKKTKHRAMINAFWDRLKLLMRIECSVVNLEQYMYLLKLSIQLRYLQYIN